MSLQNIVLNRILSNLGEQDLQTIFKDIDDIDQLFLIRNVINSACNNLPKRSVDVVLCNTFGYFNLSNKAWSQLEKLGLTFDEIYEIKHRFRGRDDPRLVKVVNELGVSASPIFSTVFVRTVKLLPYQTYFIRDNDGKEYIEKTEF